MKSPRSAFIYLCALAVRCNAVRRGTRFMRVQTTVVVVELWPPTFKFDSSYDTTELLSLLIDGASLLPSLVGKEQQRFAASPLGRSSSQSTHPSACHKSCVMIDGTGSSYVCVGRRLMRDVEHEACARTMCAAHITLAFLCKVYDVDGV